MTSTMATIGQLYDEIDRTKGDVVKLTQLVYKWHLSFFDRPDELELQIALLTGMFRYKKELGLTYWNLYFAISNLLRDNGKDPKPILKGLEP